MRLYREKLKERTLKDVDNFMDEHDMSLDEALLFNLLLEIKEIRNKLEPIADDIQELNEKIPEE